MSNFQIPSKLYKYKSINDTTSLERIIDIIDKHRIYVPTRMQLNDPLEGAHIPNIRTAICGSWLYDAQHRIHPMVEKVMDQYRILSLSSDERNMPMWAYYANNYSGICLEFSTNGVFSKALPVNYDENIISESYIDPDKKIIDSWVRKNYFTKSIGWKGEAEYRILVSAHEHYLDFKPEDLLSIHVGHNLDSKFSMPIYNICKEYHIPVYHTWYSNYDYQLYLVNMDAILNKVWNSGEDILLYEKSDQIKEKYMLRRNRV